jgi:hypothetical protein
MSQFFYKIRHCQDLPKTLRRKGGICGPMFKEVVYTKMDQFGPEKNLPRLWFKAGFRPDWTGFGPCFFPGIIKGFSVPNDHGPHQAFLV